jgi:hypothetical protein
MKAERVDDYGDDYGLRGESFQSSAVVVAVIVDREGQKRGRTANIP